MEKVNFFTAVSFGDQPTSCSQQFLEMVDSYFYLSGKKAYIISGRAHQGIEGTVLTKDSPAYLITSVKVISYLTLAIPVIVLIAKVILRSIYSFYIIDIKQEMEEGISISEGTINKIKAFMRNRGQQNDPDVVQYNSKNTVFRLERLAPNLIFKTGSDVNERFENMIKAKEVCLVHQLGLIIIPNAIKFVVDGRTFIAEKYFNIKSDESAQEQLYTELSGLDDTIRQLTTFIAKTGFSDITWRNIPILDDTPAFQGQRHIAMVDLEEMTDPETGILGREGEWGRRGLIRCLASEKQINITLAEAQRCKIACDSVTFKQAKGRRFEELQHYRALQQFYRRKGILDTPRKHIQVDDLTTLGLNLHEQGYLLISEPQRNNPNEAGRYECKRRPITLAEAASDVIAQINGQIDEAPADASPKGKRSILLNTNFGTARNYISIGNNGSRIDPSDERENQSWLSRIVNALVAKGHLFRLDNVNGHGYFIQA